MPLPYDTRDLLNIPADAFNGDAIAVLDIHGGRYGGHWVIDAFVVGTEESAGSIETCYDLDRNDLTKDAGYPGLAVDTAYVWLHDHVKKQGWRLLTWDNRNGSYGPDERPFFMAVRVAIGGTGFVPAPGVRYADEIAL